jgi:hypothetical protein
MGYASWHSNAKGDPSGSPASTSQASVVAGARNTPILATDRKSRSTIGGVEPLPSEGKGHTFESCRVRQLFFVLQRDMQTQPETSVLIHSRE